MCCLICLVLIRLVFLVVGGRGKKFVCSVNQGHYCHYCWLENEDDMFSYIIISVFFIYKDDVVLYYHIRFFIYKHVYTRLTRFSKGHKNWILMAESSAEKVWSSLLFSLVLSCLV
jgi:hypothetical protein